MNYNACACVCVHVCVCVRACVHMCMCIYYLLWSLRRCSSYSAETLKSPICTQIVKGFQNHSFTSTHLISKTRWTHGKRFPSDFLPWNVKVIQIYFVYLYKKYYYDKVWIINKFSIFTTIIVEKTRGTVSDDNSLIIEYIFLMKFRSISYSYLWRERIDAP